MIRMVRVASPTLVVALGGAAAVEAQPPAAAAPAPAGQNFADMAQRLFQRQERSGR